MIERWGELRGTHAALIIALAVPFRMAVRDELAPMNHPYIGTTSLVDQLKCGSDGTLRRRVLRCRNAIAKLAQSAGNPVPPLDAVIENHPWHGYRLNPDRIRLVALSELRKTGHALHQKGHASRRDSRRPRR